MLSSVDLPLPEDPRSTMNSPAPISRSTPRRPRVSTTLAGAPSRRGPTRGDRPRKPLREQVDLDSMDWLNVIIRLHEVMGVDIPEKDYGELSTLNGTLEYLARRCATA